MKREFLTIKNLIVMINIIVNFIKQGWDSMIKRKQCILYLHLANNIIHHMGNYPQVGYKAMIYKALHLL